ncbi:MAG: hypothetical protein RIA64_01590 [Rhodospirillales bacterium]
MIMETFTLLAFGLNLLYFLTAVAVGWHLLRWLDRKAGLPFTEALEKMRENPLALGVYYAGRVVALAILGAGFLG